MLSPVVVMSVLFLALQGWDLKVFCLSLLINTLAVALVWRYRTPAAVVSAQHPGPGVGSFIARVVFWGVVAASLFFVSKRFQ